MTANRAGHHSTCQALEERGSEFLPNNGSSDQISPTSALNRAVFLLEERCAQEGLEKGRHNFEDPDKVGARNRK